MEKEKTQKYIRSLYYTALQRYEKKYPHKDFSQMSNFTDKILHSIIGEMSKKGYEAAKEYAEKGKLVDIDTVEILNRTPVCKENYN